MYSITLAAKDGAELDAILGALKGCGLNNVRVGLNPTTKDPAPVTPPPQIITPTTVATATPEKSGKRKRMYANGIQNKGTTAVKLFLEVVSREPRVYSIEEIEKEFVGHDFARTSAAATASMLVSADRVKKVAAGRFCLPGLTIHKPER